MERLTDKNWQNLDPWECCGQVEFCKRTYHSKGGCANGCIVPKLYAKLAQYEDLEEQGRLVKLPCKVRDTIYVIIYDYEKEQYAIKASEIIEVRENINGWFFISLISKPAFRFKDFGKIVFLTKAEAEAKLKEMRGEENER